MYSSKVMFVPLIYIMRIADAAFSPYVVVKQATLPLRERGKRARKIKMLERG
jgi:hypothetical protein